MATQTDMDMAMHHHECEMRGRPITDCSLCRAGISTHPILRHPGGEESYRSTCRTLAAFREREKTRQALPNIRSQIMKSDDPLRAAQRIVIGPKDGLSHLERLQRRYDSGEDVGLTKVKPLPRMDFPSSI